MRKRGIFLPVIAGGALAFAVTLSTASALAVNYTGASAEDPFYYEPGKDMIVKTAGADELLTLQGVVWKAHPPKAIINGNIVTIGSQVNGAEVIRIDREGVLLRASGRDFLLTTDKKKDTQ